MNNKKLEEFNNFIRFRKVAVIGLGVSNIPLLDYLYLNQATVTVFDNREEAKIPTDMMEKIKNYGFSYSFGEKALETLHHFAVIFRSPSCLPTQPELEEEAKNGAIVTTEIELFMKLCPAKIIGVTGSDGKTTTTSLIYAILQDAGYHSFLGGNIGTPLFTKLPEITPDDIVVLELSSFQLMGMDVSPQIAAITNITPNHLNIHKNYDEYIHAKKNIFQHQDESGILVLNYDNEITRNCAQEAKGKVIFFSSTQKLENGYMIDENKIKFCQDKIRKHILNVEDVILKGKHNYENIATALAVTETLVDLDTAIDTIKTFSPVAHRIEFVRTINGTSWYNDSASSSPTRTIAGLRAFDTEKIVLIAGGYDKNLDYSVLAKPILEKVSTLILMGQTTGKIFEVVKAEMEQQKKQIPIYIANDLDHAISLAKKYAKPEEVVLFSPASASFDMFKNAVERGEKFKEKVQNL